MKENPSPRQKVIDNYEKTICQIAAKSWLYFYYKRQWLKATA